MSKAHAWEAPPLDSKDEALVDAYLAVGTPVDELPHTQEMTQLAKRLGEPDTDASKHAIFKRLLRLRKMGRLPRVIGAASVGSSRSSASVD